MAQWERIHLQIQETQETWVQSLGQEDSLEEEMATCSRILAWEAPRTEKLEWERRKESDTTEHASKYFIICKCTYAVMSDS